MVLVWKMQSWPPQCHRCCINIATISLSFSIGLQLSNCRLYIHQTYYKRASAIKQTEVCEMKLLTLSCFLTFILPQVPVPNCLVGYNDEGKPNGPVEYRSELNICKPRSILYSLGLIFCHVGASEEQAIRSQSYVPFVVSDIWLFKLYWYPAIVMWKMQRQCLNMIMHHHKNCPFSEYFSREKCYPPQIPFSPRPRWTWVEKELSLKAGWTCESDEIVLPSGEGGVSSPACAW